MNNCITKLREKILRSFQIGVGKAFGEIQHLFPEENLVN